jgi:CTP synthase
VLRIGNSNLQAETEMERAEAEEGGGEEKQMKYIIVSGGVVSGLGKGVTASSLGVLLKACGYIVTAIKIDPYLNVDAGTISPFEHGEVFVLDDGGESDLDLGNYERFLDVTLASDNNITTGKVYNSVIRKERRGDFLGKTVQVVPHVSDSIQQWIESVARRPVSSSLYCNSPDVCVVELGGTVGDIESMPFVEAIRQFQFNVGRENICLVHVSLVPTLGDENEQKTKPTQHSVQSLRSLGLSPDMLACRSTEPLEHNVKEKLALFCHVLPEAVLNLHDVSNIWQVPVLMQQEGALATIGKKLNLPLEEACSMQRWERMANQLDSLTETVRIAMVGKYTHFGDSYLSVSKALMHAGVHCMRKVKVELVESAELENGVEQAETWSEANYRAAARANGHVNEIYEKREESATASPKGDSANASEQHSDAWARLASCDAVLIPGGFGDRGIEGKIAAARYARKTDKPFLGICLGMQVAVVEHARSQLLYQRANSTEFEESTPHPAVVYMPEQSETSDKGGTMRLGLRKTQFRAKDSMAYALYGYKNEIEERHRHRWEVNPEMVPELESVGMRFVGTDMSGERMEVMECRDHQYFVGTQFHPEFKSRPGQPSPLFTGLMLAAQKQLASHLQRPHSQQMYGSPFSGGKMR